MLHACYMLRPKSRYMLHATCGQGVKAEEAGSGEMEVEVEVGVGVEMEVEVEVEEMAEVDLF